MTNGQQDSPGPSAVGETDPSTAELLVHTLGPPKVEYAGQPLAIPRRQTRALLYRLAARLEPVGRERLAFLFWPDKPDATARRNLSQLLSLLRHALPHRDWLLTSRSHVRLDREFVWSDAAAFEALCGARDAYDRIEKLKQAVSLYRGPFLSGVTLSGSPEYEAWMSETRYTLEHLYLEALKTLIDAEGAQGAYDAAITHALDYLAVDELAEDVHRQLVELYASGGDRDAALRQYETCAAILERELGVDPLPETRAVYEAVRAGEILPAPPVTAPTWTTLPSLYAPLVGRDAALRRLRTARRRAQASQGGIVLISGEAGVGKSRLLQEFASLHGEAVVLAGGGYADTQAIPYHPIVEALRSAPDLYALASHLQPVWLAEAARLLPELHTRYTDLPPPQEAEPEQARGRLFEALNRLILEPAAAQPVLLCLDDLHWADATTLEWLAQLGRRLTRRSHSSRLLVLGTFRSEEAGTVRDLRHSLTRLDRGAVLELRPLDVAAVRQLLRHLAGPSAAGDVATRRLHHVTGGNPYFLLELLRVLVESGQSLSNLTDLETFPLPDSIREAVLVRLDRLSPVARQVLEAGAVLGPIFEFQVVHRTTGRGELEALEGLDELLGRQVLLEQAVPEQALPGHPQHYRFQHELLRSAIYETLSYGRRQLLHRRAGEALEARLPRRRGLPSERPDGELVARLAHHFTEAGETKKAIDYLLEAGDRARHLNAHEEAIDHYEQALAFLEQQGDDERAARTLMKLGLTYHTAFDFDRSREAYAEGFAIWQRAGTGQPVAPPPAPHALRISGGDPITLDPTFCNYMGSSIILDQLFSGLVALTPEMDVVPDVAASWEVTDGGRKYIFHLRDDVLWSDGVPVTAHDFEFAWQRRLDPTTESPVASFLYDVKGARAFHQGQISDPGRVGVRSLDDRTLVVELEGPTSYFLHLLELSTTFPEPRHSVEASGDGWTDPNVLVTNGPFRLMDWQRGAGLSLARNPTYHGQFTGNVQQVEYLVSRAWSSLLELYAEHQLDVLSLAGIGYLPIAELDAVRRRHAAEYIFAPDLGTWCVGFDVSRPPFSDRRVRRAFVLATDREWWADDVERGTVSPGTGGFVPPGMTHHSPDIGLPHDPEQARRLLAEAGYPDVSDFPAVTVVWPDEPRSAFQCAQLQQRWRVVLDVDIPFERPEPGAYLDMLQEQPPHIFFMGWLADYPDPDNFLRVGFLQQPTEWRNAEYIRLVEQARRIADQAARMKLYRQADRMLIDEAVILPLCYTRSHLLIKPWVKQYPLSPVKRWFWKDVVIEPHR